LFNRVSDYGIIQGNGSTTIKATTISTTTTADGM